MRSKSIAFCMAFAAAKFLGCCIGITLFAATSAMFAGAAQSPHRFTVTLNYSGAAAENVPTLLRISPSKISGFSYGDTADGTDFEIRDENGTLLPYEIDTWDTSGESLLWVQVPLFAD